MVELILPYPPSGNHMWKHAAGKHYLTEEARRYYRIVKHLVMQSGSVINIDFRMHVVCVLNPPDNRRRDMDNAWKVISDAITKAGVWQDDSLIRSLHIEWGSVVKGGAVRVTIARSDAETVSC